MHSNGNITLFFKAGETILEPKVPFYWLIASIWSNFVIEIVLGKQLLETILVEHLQSSIVKIVRPNIALFCSDCRLFVHISKRLSDFALCTCELCQVLVLRFLKQPMFVDGLHMLGVVWKSRVSG